MGINSKVYPNPNEIDLESLRDMTYDFLKKRNYGAARFYSSFVVDTLDDLFYGKIPDKYFLLHEICNSFYDISEKAIQAKLEAKHFRRQINLDEARVALGEYSRDWILDKNLRDFYDLPLDEGWCFREGVFEIIFLEDGEDYDDSDDDSDGEELL